MSTCCWCTPGGSATIQILKSYASANSEFDSANDDLCYCLECVDEYHKARDEVPSLHEALWELETGRLIAHFETSLKESGEDDDLYIMEGESKIPFSCYTGPGFEKHVRVPMLEILKYPYLLLHERLSELFVEALCKMEQINYSYQVVGKHPGIYLLMVHPNEVIRRWAILTARNLGKVDRDDYYDIQEVLTCLLKVIELGLFENPDIYNSSVFEKGKLILLPSHLYDTTNYKNYWLGICMLLMVLEERALDSLLLGPNKQNDFMQSIMNTMKKQTDDDRRDPFWPALHCFMVILDKVGSKVWGHLIDPIQAFQTIINNESYKKEIENIRQSCRRTKSEPLSDYGDDMITCSQIVYNCHLERPSKDTGRKSAVCPDYCPSLYDDMQTLTDMFQYDIGRDMQLHNSTFLWYIPFVHSLMDLKDLGVAYSVVVIHHLCSEIKEVLDGAVLSCDKVSEFFIWILVTVVELNLKKHCLNSLWVSSETWVEAVVKCARLPSTVFTRGVERGLARNGSRNASAVSSWESESVQWACMNLIRSILREGYQMGQDRTQFLDQLNMLRRTREDWNLSPQEAQELQACLKHIIRNIQNKPSNPPSHTENTVACVAPPAFTIKQENQDDRYPVSSHGKLPSYLSPRGNYDGYPEDSPSGRRCSLDTEVSPKEPNLHETSGCYLTNIKQEPEEILQQDNVTSLREKGHTEAQKCGSCHQGRRDSTRNDSFHQGFQGQESKDGSGEDKRPRASGCLVEKNGISETKMALVKLRENLKPTKFDLTLKLKQFVENKKRENRPLQSIEEGSKDQEGQRGNLIAGYSSTPDKLGVNSTHPLHGKPLSIKRESKDSLVEFKHTLKVQQNLEEDSSEDEMAHVPLSQIRQDLVKKKLASAVASPGTDSQIDRDLNKLSLAAHAKATSFPVDSSQEDTPRHQNPIKRKVQGAVKSLSDSETKSKPLLDTDEPRNQVIIISDTSSDEDENKVNIGREGKEEGRVPCLEKQHSARGPESAATASRSPSLYEDLESQCFEFETEEDIYSAWQDSQIEEKAEDEGPQGEASRSPEVGDLEIAQQINDWGYETDYLGEDVTEKAAEDLELQVSESHLERKLHVAAGEGSSREGNGAGHPSSFPPKQADDVGCSRHTVPVVPSTSASAASCELRPDLSKFKMKPGKSLADSPRAKTANRSPRRRNLNPAVRNEKSPLTKPFRSTPAVVPPRKVHKFPEPTLVTEKLFLKKKIRRAAELSQRTQDSITKLRAYGKTAGELPQQRRTKLIQAPPLVGRNRKMLSSRERHFFSQKKHKEREKGQCQSRGDGAIQVAKITKKPGLNPCLKSASLVAAQNQKEKTPVSSHSTSSERKLIKQSSVGGERAQSTSDSSRKEFPLTGQGSVSSVQENTTTLPSSSSSSVTGGNPTGPRTSLGCSASLCIENVASKEGPSKLSENPTADEDSLFLTQRDPVDMELCSQVEAGPSSADTDVSLPQSPFQDSTEMRKDAGCADRAGASCGNDSTSDPLGHVFAKPFPPAKPSTAKIFSSASSRSANLTKDLEDGPKPPAALKSRSNAIRPRLALESVKPRPVTSTGGLRPRNMNPISQPAGRANGHGGRDGRMLPAVSGGGSRPEAQPSGMNAQHRDHNVFIKEVLKWSYDMFANFSQLGTPDHLHQKIVGRVPVQFRDYNDYFNTFFPLTMLNAFEEVSGFQIIQVAPRINGFRRPGHSVQDDCSSLTLASLMQCTWISCGLFMKNEMEKVVKKGKAFLSNCAGMADGLQEWVGHVYCPVLNPVFTPPPLQVGQEWLENQKSREQKPFRLHLLNYSADLNKADFVANFSKSDLEEQLHPKEHDLVFLKVSEQQSYSEESKAENELACHVGLVTRFSLPSIHDSKSKEQQALCHLSIQTQGNLSHVHKEVRCVVASSLVTTQRRFTALLTLHRRCLARAIISPSYRDFCPRDLNVDAESSPSCTNDLNEDQRRAIETAYAMITQEPTKPKICLIHGPPGTGKSKTIVGLLYRLFSETSGKENRVQSLNAKIKSNRVLVCAPSNTAVDDLMKKIILEFKGKCPDKKKISGNCGEINLVRLGQQKSINKKVLQFSLDDQVNRINKAALGRNQDLQRRKEDLDQQLDMLSRQRAMDRNEKREKRQQLDEKISQLMKERQCLASELKQARGGSQELRASIILKSHIICCTLSTSGGKLLESAFLRLGGDPVSCVIVDEAGQTCEVETLIPLLHGCRKLVLVGDPKQLPPTVKSRKAQDCGYDQSLMGRLCQYLKLQEQENQAERLPVLQLTTQYRMHPDIWLFPAKYIYKAAVVTDEKTQENRCSLEWPFQPYMLFDVSDGREEQDNNSYANPQEVKLVIELIKLITAARSGVKFSHIGIITPYSAQKRRIQNQLDKEFGENSACEVDTVDGFQGCEKDCIIVTCVRANSTQGSIGFLRSLQRLNVTITRAKYSLFIVGKLKTLMENEDWNQLIQDAQKRGSIFRTSSSNYKAVAQKILKLKRDRLGQGQAGPPRSKLSEVPRRDSHHPTAGALGSSRVQPLPAPPESSSSSSSSSRVESAMATSACLKGNVSTPSSSGAASPLGPDAPPAQRSQSVPSPQLSSNSLMPGLHPQAFPAPTQFPGAQDRDWRVPITAAAETKTLGRGDHPNPVKLGRDWDSRRRTAEMLQEGPAPIDAKRRRTTH
nr:probable helicase senataxin [Pogona vitticeps]